MARHVVDNLGRCAGVGKFRVVALAVVYLRVRRRGYDADFHGLLVARLAGGETTVFGVTVVSFHGIADVVREYGNPLHLVYILFEGASLGRQRRVAGSPPFAIDENRWVDFLELGGDFVHRLDVVYGHEVEAEAVDVIFLRPVFHRVDDKVAHHLAVRGGLVAAARGIAVAAVGAVAVEVARGREREVRGVVVGGVVIYHVHHHAYAGIVEGLYHFLHLAYAGCGVGGVGRVAPFGRVVVIRVIAPVILVRRQVGLVYRVVVIRRQYVHVGHAEFLQVVYAGGAAFGRLRVALGKGQELALVHYARRGVDAEVAVVHLVEHGIGYVVEARAVVLVPSGRIGGRHVDYCGAVPVGADGFGPYARGLVELLAVDGHGEGIELAI